MGKITIVRKPKTTISEKLKEEMKKEEYLQGQVVIHCTFVNTNYIDCLIRIWKTTFLTVKNSDHKSTLHHAENIRLYPLYTNVLYRQSHNFTLVFSSLPKDCTHFDLLEEIPEPGEFHVKNIPRNESDVYHVNIS
jgi:hypothetical protein